MKRLLVPVCIIIIAIVLFSGTGKSAGENGTAEISSVSEAAFAVRNYESEDATKCLVGRFLGDDGTRLNFDGSGTVERAAVNLDLETGSYQLTEAAGIQLLQMDFGGDMKLYSLQMIQEEPGFRMTDADGNSVIFRPVL